MTTSEATATYCRICGHKKEHHDLNIHPEPGKNKIGSCEPACDQMSFDDHRCICVGYESWTFMNTPAGVPADS